jgi:hypothetical protein
MSSRLTRTPCNTAARESRRQIRRMVPVAGSWMVPAGAAIGAGAGAVAVTEAGAGAPLLFNWPHVAAVACRRHSRVMKWNAPIDMRSRM